MNNIRTVFLLAIFFMAHTSLSFGNKETNDPPCTVTATVMSTNAVTPCSYSCNGLAVIAATGGTAPYTVTGPFTSSPVSFTSVGTLTGFCAGTFTLTIVDAAGCSVPLVVTIGGPTAISFTTSVTPATSGCNGSITVTASGGTSPYIFSNDGGTSYQASNSFNSLCAGTYNICVQDVNGCVSCLNVNVTGCGMVSTVFGMTAASCFGACDGTTIIASTGGTPPYMVTVGGSTYTYSGTLTVTGLCAGAYTVVTTDASGCSYPLAFTITSPPALTLSLSMTPESSPGMCDGSITSTASGGTPAYTYSLDGGTYGSVGNFSAICAGTHTVCVKDANGCTQCTNITVTGSGGCSMVSTVGGIVNASCSGTCDGSAIIVSTLGTAPYLVTLSTGATFTYAGSVTITGLCPGTYIANIIDAMGCSNTVTFVISAPPAITISATSTDASSSSASDGTILITASGGTGSLVYSIDNGTTFQASPNFTGLPIGTYDVCAMDANGCIQCTTVTISAASCTFVSTAYVLSGITCYGDCNAVVGVAASGGTAPYIAAAGGATTTFTTSGTLTGLCAGPYAITFTDAAGCTSMYTVMVTSPSAITLSVSSTPESTVGACDGTIAITASGGTPAYTYTIDGSSSSASATGICGGLHTVCVTDANGCTTCDTVYIPTSSCTMTTTTTLVAESCYGICNGMVVLSTTGGTAPYTVTFAGVTHAPYTSTKGIGGLCSGTYTVYITDAAGCTEYFSVTLTSPAPVTVSATSTSATSGCNGSISVTAGGGTPGYQYSVDNGITWQSSSTFNSLCGGTYTVCVQDANGCYACTTVVVTNTSCTMTTTAIPTNATCNGTCDGAATIITTGGTTPYVVTVGSMTATYTSSTTFTGLCAGTYVATVNDAAGCTNVYTFIVTEPSPIATTVSSITNASTSTSCDGSITAATTGGTPSYMYAWYNCSTGASVSGTGSTVTGLCAGTYAYVVTDANGCSDSASCVTVGSGTGVNDLNHETAFSIYPNPTNGLITVVIEGNGKKYPVILTDVLGKTLARCDVQNKVTLDLNAMQLNNGVYFITIIGENKTGQTKKIMLTR